MSPVLPPREDEGEKVPVSFRFPEKIVRRLKDISAESNYEMTEVVIHALRHFFAAYDAEKAEEKKGAGKK